MNRPDEYTDQVYGSYLATSYALRNDLSEEGLAGAARMFERQFGPYLPADKQAPILEIGCGSGAFLRCCRDLGYTDVRGLDISRDQVEFCRRQGFEQVVVSDARGYLEREPDSYALVVLSDVLEHMPKPEGVATMRAVQARLEPRGRVVVRVPNMSNPLNLQARYGDFTHEVGFSKESMEQLLRISGLEVETIYGAHGAHRRLLARLVFDLLLWKAFVLFYRHTMQLKREVLRGKNLIAVARKEGPVATAEGDAE